MMINDEAVFPERRKKIELMVRKRIRELGQAPLELSRKRCSVSESTPIYNTILSSSPRISRAQNTVVPFSSIPVADQQSFARITLLRRFAVREEIEQFLLRRPKTSVDFSNKAEKNIDNTDNDGSEKDDDNEEEMVSTIKALFRGARKGLIEDSPRGLAENLLQNYFSVETRKLAPAVTRVGAGVFQAEILKEFFDVTNIIPSGGAYIFDGRYITRNSKEFSEKLTAKFAKSSYAEDLDFIITLNRRFPSENDTITDMVYSVLEESTSVLLFPKVWNSTLVPTLEQEKLRNIVRNLNVVSSAIVAGNCYNLFDPQGPLLKIDQLPDGLIGLAILPLVLQLIPLIVESLVAKYKGINLTFVQLPGWVSLPTFGYRTIYTSKAKTRNDIFDTAASGWFTSFVLSLVTALIGLQLTAVASPDTVASFPTIPIALLKSNPIVTQVFTNQFPNAVLNAPNDALVHLHWVAIAGMFSLLINVLQLIPSPQTAGSKLVYALRGASEYTIILGFAAIARFVFNLFWLFASWSAVGSVFTVTSRQSLLFTFLLSEVQGFFPDTNVRVFL